MLLIGATTGGTTGDFNTAGFIMARRIQAAETGMLDKIWWHTKVANPTVTSIWWSVYADTGSTTQPGALLLSWQQTDRLAEVQSVNPFAGQAPFPIKLTKGTFYWLGVSMIGEQQDWLGDVAGGYAEKTMGASPPNPFGTPASNGTTSPLLWAEQSKVFDLSGTSSNLGPTAFLPAGLYSPYYPVRRSTPYRDLILTENPLSFVRSNDNTILAYDELRGPGFWGYSSDSIVPEWPNAILTEDGGSFRFNQATTTSYIFSDNICGSGLSDFSAEFWIKFPTPPGSFALYRIAHFQEIGIILEYSTDGLGTGTFTVMNNDGFGDVFNWNVTLNPSGWNHVVFATDSALEYFLFVNSLDQGLQFGTSGLGYTGNITSEWGADSFSGLSADCVLDEMAMYGYPLIGPQVTSHYLAAGYTLGGGGPQTIALGQVNETDTSQSFSRRKVKAFGQVTETDTSQTFTKAKRKAFGQISETNTSQPFTTRKIKLFGQTTETDTSQPITRKLGQTILMGIISETDTSQPMTHRKIKAFGQITETDTSQPFTSRKIKAFGQIAETDISQPFTKVKRKALGLNAETDTSQSMTHRKIKAFGQITETDTAQTIRAQKARTLGQPFETDSATTWKTPAKVQIVVETDTSQPFNRIKIKAIGLNSETDTSQPFVKRKTKAFGQVTETDVSQAFTRKKIKLLGQPSEVNTSQSMTGFLAHFVNQTVETDTSQPFARRKIKAIGQTTETDVSQTFGRIKRRIIGQPSETDLSQSIKVPLRVNIITEVDIAQNFIRVKRRTLGLPTETETAQPFARRKIRVIGMNFETDLAQPMLKKHRKLLGLPTETDTAFSQRPGHGHVIGQVLELDTALAVSTIGVQLDYTPREFGMRIRGNDVRVSIRGGSRGRMTDGPNPDGRIKSGSDGRIRGGTD